MLGQEKDGLSEGLRRGVGIWNRNIKGDTY